MSQMCLLVLENVPHYQKELVLSQTIAKACKYGLGIVLKPSESKYKDIITHFNCTESMCFCISDNFQVSTCEKIFCPDWCNANDEKVYSFSDYLNFIQSIVSILYSTGYPVHLFIGNDLGLYSDYNIEYCSINDLACSIEVATNREGFVPDMHIIIQ